jgi:hypothetical protein
MAATSGPLAQRVVDLSQSPPRASQIGARLCQFQSDVATADHDKMIRHTLEVQRFDMRHRSGISEPRHIRNARACADTQDMLAYNAVEIQPIDRYSTVEPLTLRTKVTSRWILRVMLKINTSCYRG